MNRLSLILVASSLDGLENHPRIKCALRYKESLSADLLKKLVKRGQVELIFDPVLALIPDDDKLGQIKLMSQFFKENFLKSSQGVCLAGGVWEPHYPKIFKQTDLEYALVDEELFPQPTQKACLTEYEGEKFLLFPIHRYLSQFHSPEEVIDYLKQLHEDEPAGLAVILDDGKSSYPLEKLYLLFEEHSSWLELITPEVFLEENSPKGLVYLASNSDGLYRHLLKDFDANNRHKKIQQVSRQLKVAGGAKGLFGRHEKEAELEKARRHLYLAEQGGEVYHNLILAEVELDKIKHGSKPFVELVVTDFDKDGCDEVIISNNILSVYVSPAKGGSIFELDYKPRGVNLLAGRSLVDHLIDEQLSEYHFMPLRQAGEAGVRLTKIVGKTKIEKTISLLPSRAMVDIEYILSGELDGQIFGLEFKLKPVDEIKEFAVSLGFSQEPAEPLKWHLSGNSWKLKINLKVE